MSSIIGAILFGIISILTILVTCGLPLGEFTMGGKYKVLPTSMRITSGVSFFIQLFAIMIVLQTGGYISTFLSFKLAKVLCYIFAGYLSINSLMNSISRSKKEKFVMTPLSIIAAICFWITAIGA